MCMKLNTENNIEELLIVAIKKQFSSLLCHLTYAVVLLVLTVCLLEYIHHQNINFTTTRKPFRTVLTLISLTLLLLLALTYLIKSKLTVKLWSRDVRNHRNSNGNNKNVRSLYHNSGYSNDSYTESSKKRITDQPSLIQQQALAKKD